MRIIPSRNIGDIDRDSPITDKLMPLTLEQAVKRFKGLPTKTAYYVRTNRDGTSVFGLEGNANLIEIPENVYEAIGRPDTDVNVPVSYILKKAGYK